MGARNLGRKIKEKKEQVQGKKRTENRQRGNEPPVKTEEMTEDALKKKFPDLDVARQCPYCENKDKKYNHPYVTCNWRPGDA